MPASARSAHHGTGLGRPLASAVAFLVAAVILALGASSASAFGVSGFSYTNSTLQAAGHPNVTTTFTRTGSDSEDLRDVRLDLPTGVWMNPESVTTKCTAAQFNSDACPSTSQVGTISTDTTVAGILNITVPGTIYVIPADAGQAATLGMVLRPSKVCILMVFCAVPNKIFLKAQIGLPAADGAGLRTFTQGRLSLGITGIPLIFAAQTLTIDITVNRMSFAFQARSGSGGTGPYFLTNTTSCSLATAGVTITSYQSVVSSANASFTPTGCASVPDNPSVSVTPGSTTAASATTLGVAVNVPLADATIQNTHLASIDVALPTGSGIALDALATATPCSEAQLVADTCPASSRLGTASVTVPSLPPAFTGYIYATGGIGNQFPIAVRVVGPRSTTLLLRGTLGARGDTGTGTARAYLLLDKLPQLPYSSLVLNFTTPAYRNPATCGTATTTATITGASGSAVTRSSSYTAANCAPAPDTTITSGPPSTTTSNTPTFTMTSSLGGSQFQCRVDGGASHLCSSPFTTEPLTNGPHTVTVSAQNDTTLDPSPATSTFTVSSSGPTITPAIVPSTTQAAAHPDLSATFDISGAQPKTVQLKLPPGMAARLGAPNPCTLADAAAGTCAAASKIGTGQVTVDTTGGPVSGSGDVFLTQAPTGADAGGFAVKFAMAGGNFIAQGGVRELANAEQQAFELRNIPTVIGSTAITVRQLALTISGSTGFLTNPSSCTADTGFATTGTDASGNQAGVNTVPFQATGCSSVAFAPSVAESLSSPTAGTVSGSTTQIALPSPGSSVKTLRADLPAALSLNLAALGLPADRCASAAVQAVGMDFNPALCPAQARIGTVSITTPIAASPLVGDIYLIDKAPLPMLGVAIDQGGVSMRATAMLSFRQLDPTCVGASEPLGYCASAVSLSTRGLPDLPASDIVLTLDGPDRVGTSATLSGKPFQVAPAGAPSCASPSPSTFTVTPFTGTASVASTPAVAISGC